MTMMIGCKHIEAKNIEGFDFPKETICQYIFGLYCVFSEAMSFKVVKKSLVKLLGLNNKLINEIAVFLSAKIRRQSCDQLGCVC